MTLEAIVKDSLRFDSESKITEIRNPPRGLFVDEPLCIKFENGSKMLYYPCEYFKKKIHDAMKEE